MNTDLFERFAPVLRSSTPPAVRDERLLIETSEGLSVYYAPFEYVNPRARVVLVGITPGPTQMVNANNEARRALLAGQTHGQAIKSAKAIGAFSGNLMRQNLISQLNHWGFHTWLNLRDCGELFGTANHLLQTTSLLRYPVFAKGKDYRGTPDMTKHPLLREHLLTHFVSETKEMKDALFISLGPQVQKVLNQLLAERVIDDSRIVNGLLHPSGNCTYRINYLTGDREGPVPHATNPTPYDQGRKAFQGRYLSP